LFTIQIKVTACLEILDSPVPFPEPSDIIRNLPSIDQAYPGCTVYHISVPK